MNKLILFFLGVFLVNCGKKKHKSINIDTVINYNAQKLLENTNAFGVSIAIVKDGETFTKHFGEIDKGKGNKITDNTLFEIASVTKVFTGTLMAKAFLERKIDLEDDIRKYLPDAKLYANLQFKNNPIKIKHLLSFKTGILQRFPDISSLRMNEDDSTTFRLKKFDEGYSKTKFFEDLKKVKLDTLPGSKYSYNELCPEFSGYILEKIYGKSYREIVQEQILDKLHMNSTMFELKEGMKLLNGYNQNEILMPNFSYNIWGAGGMLKSTLTDISKFLKYQLDLENKIVKESHRNFENSLEGWHGYLWDYINIDRSGLVLKKHGGAYGVQNMFVVYPEQNIGISIVINQSSPTTAEYLHYAYNSIVADLIYPNLHKDKISGYETTANNIVFKYQHSEKLDDSLIKSISLVGSFNDWNPNHKSYNLINKGNGLFELAIPKSNFEKGKLYEYKFIINKTSWLTTPKKALNREKGKYNNLTFML